MPPKAPNGEVEPNAPPVGCEENPPNPPAPAGLGLLEGTVENIDARNGFAPPGVPVACGRSPTPSDDDVDDEKDDDPSPVGCAPSPGKPVGCDVSVVPELDAGGEVAGVDGADGMGGSDSSSAAPNDEDGLNALMPLNPVVCL